MRHEFAIELLTTRIALLRQVLKFNGLDATPAELKKLEDNAELFALLNVPEVARCLRRPNLGLFEFENKANRLALLGNETCTRLKLYLGACAYAHEIAQLVHHEDVRALKAAIGEEIYAFAVGRGQFYMSQKLKESLKLSYPSKAYDVLKAGAMMLALLAQKADTGYDEALLRPDLTLHLELEDSLYEALFALTLKILYKEVDATWQDIFS